MPTKTHSCQPHEPVPTPGNCEHEKSVAHTSDLGACPKSLCTINGSEIWTNCRSWGRCTMRGDVFGHLTGDAT